MVMMTANKGNKRGKKTEYFGLPYVGEQCLDSTMATCYKVVLFFNGDCTMARDNGMLLQLLFNQSIQSDLYYHLKHSKISPRK